MEDDVELGEINEPPPYIVAEHADRPTVAQIVEAIAAEEKEKEISLRAAAAAARDQANAEAEAKENGQNPANAGHEREGVPLIDRGLRGRLRRIRVNYVRPCGIFALRLVIYIIILGVILLPMFICFGIHGQFEYTSNVYELVQAEPWCSDVSLGHSMDVQVIGINIERDYWDEDFTMCAGLCINNNPPIDKWCTTMQTLIVSGEIKVDYYDNAALSFSIHPGPIYPNATIPIGSAIRGRATDTYAPNATPSLVKVCNVLWITWLTLGVGIAIFYVTMECLSRRGRAHWPELPQRIQQLILLPPER
jgi:hypothetical protein